MSAITVGGDLVHYEVLGRGRPVILVHTWIGSWRYWIPLMRLLQLKYRVYAVDLFGFGDSSKNDVKYTLKHQVELMSEFMRHLEISKAAIIGHGLGAMITAKFAETHADKIARMMLVSMPLFNVGDLSKREPGGTRVYLNTPKVAEPAPAITPQPSATPNTDATIARRPKGFDLVSPADPTIASVRNQTVSDPAQFRAMLQKAALEKGSSVLSGQGADLTSDAEYPVNNPLRDKLANASPGTLLNRCFRSSEPEYEKLISDVTHTDPQVIERSILSYDAGAMLDTLATLPVPVMIVHGEDDPLLDPPDEDVRDYISRGKDDSQRRLIPLDGVRHFPMLEHDPFMRLVGDFLEKNFNEIAFKERWRRRSR
jgi:pimeloyl-ACP methyl ester carboxylesterase